jgi:hypothetical protein
MRTVATIRTGSGRTAQDAGQPRLPASWSACRRAWSLRVDGLRGGVVEPRFGRGAAAGAEARDVRASTEKQVGLTAGQGTLKTTLAERRSGSSRANGVKEG